MTGETVLGASYCCICSNHMLGSSNSLKLLTSAFSCLPLLLEFFRAVNSASFTVDLTSNKLSPDSKLRISRAIISNENTAGDNDEKKQSVVH
jgi:hypothetical protein